MVSVKMLTIINISLALIALFLFINLLGFKLPSLGQAFVSLDKTAPLCVVQWKEEFTPWENTDRCCMEARRQLGCTREQQEFSFGEVQWHCKTGAGNVPTIWLNSKAYASCQQEAFW